MKRSSQILLISIWILCISIGSLQAQNMQYSICEGESVLLDPNKQNILYDWTPLSGLECSIGDCDHTYVSPQSTTSYTFIYAEYEVVLGPDPSPSSSGPTIMGAYYPPYGLELPEVLPNSEGVYPTFIIEVGEIKEIVFDVSIENCDPPAPVDFEETGNEETAYAGAGESYPAWLVEVLDEGGCCDSEKVYRYQTAGTAYYYVQPSNNYSCGGGAARLYDQYGNQVCTSNNGTNCYQNYNLAYYIDAQLIWECAPGSIGPCGCDDTPNPVCGGDGSTYLNPCLAECVGMAWLPGSCEEQAVAQPCEALDLSWLDEIIADSDCCTANSVLYYENNEGEILYYISPSYLYGCPQTTQARVYDCHGELVCSNESNNNCYYNLSLWSYNNSGLYYKCESNCYESDPVEELFWMEDLINNSDCCHVDRIFHYSDGVYSFFYVDPAYPNTAGCAWGAKANLYDCDGNMLCEGGECYSEYSLYQLPGRLSWSCSNKTSNVNSTINQMLQNAPIAAYTSEEFSNAEKGILTNKQSMQVKVYPNPSEDVCFIELDEVQGESKIEVLNINGQLLTEDVFNGPQYRLTMKDHSTKGVFFLRITNNQKTVVQRIILH